MKYFRLLNGNWSHVNLKIAADKNRFSNWFHLLFCYKPLLNYL